MLLKLINKHKFILALVGTLLSSISYADEQSFVWHGYISQGVIQSENSNFINDDGDLSFELTELGINGSYQISPSLRATSQVTYINGGNRLSDGARLDYLLLDWAAVNTFDWQVNLYLGRTKSYNLLHSSTRDVPMVRPSIILPQSVYFDAFRDTAIGGDGAVLAVSYTSSQYGEFDFTLGSGPTQLTTKQTKTLMGELAEGDLDHRKDLQLALYWRPIDSNWQYGIALLDAAFQYQASEFDRLYQNGSFVIERANINAMYQGEHWEFVTELNFSRLIINDFIAPGFFRDSIGQGFYSQLRYHLTDKIRLLTRYERFYSNRDDKNGSLASAATGGRVPSYFGFHNDVTAGISYDVADSLRLQLEHHWVKGGARLAPALAPNVTLNDSEYWRVWAAQLTYWF